MMCNLSRILLSFPAIALFSMTISIAEIGNAETAELQSQRRLRSTFFEEEQEVELQGFTNTFLNDALNGVADPLQGSGSVNTTVDSLQKTQIQTGDLSNRAAPFNITTPTPAPAPASIPLPLSPGFDRTNVIIR